MRGEVSLNRCIPWGIAQYVTPSQNPNPPTQVVEFIPRPIKNKTKFYERFVVFSQKRNLEKSKILQIKRKNSFYLYRAGATEMVEFTDPSPTIKNQKKIY